MASREQERGKGAGEASEGGWGTLWCFSTPAQTGKRQGGGGSNGGDALCMVATSKPRAGL